MKQCQQNEIGREYMYKVPFVDKKDQTQMLMGGHGLEQVRIKSMEVLVDSEQLNVSTKEAYVIFDYINKNIIPRMREVKVQYGKTTPETMCYEEGLNDLRTLT